jgi:hypothetical protein
MYDWTMGHCVLPKIFYQNSINTILTPETLAGSSKLAIVKFDIPKPSLLTPEQIQSELRMTESWGRYVRGDISNSYVPRSLEVVVPISRHIEID